MPSSHYKGWDVHAYTPEIRQWFQQYLLPRLHDNGVFLTEWMQLMKELRAVYQNVPAVHMALNKMQKRYSVQVRGYFDGDLGPGGNVASILKYTWQKVKSMKEPSIVRLFGEILIDIGSTCVQGDSHRLVWFLFGLTSSSS